MSPEAKFPTALDRVVDVVDWLGASGAGFRVSPDRLAIGGDSAGANLALASALLPSREDAANPLACPLNAELRGTPPTFLTIPELDILSEQSLLLAERLRSAGVSVRAEYYPGAIHSFLEAVGVAAVADRALTDGARWLEQTLAKRPEISSDESASQYRGGCCGLLHCLADVRLARTRWIAAS